MGIAENRVLKIFLFSLGILSLILGIIGIFLPLLPTTPFVLLAAWCFLRSSTKTHQWIYRQPVLGPTLRNWENGQSISRSTKILAISMITFSGIMIWRKVTVLWVAIPVLLLLLGVALFIATRAERSPPS